MARPQMCWEPHTEKRLVSPEEPQGSSLSLPAMVRAPFHSNTSTGQVFGLHISKGIEGIRAMRAQNRQAARAGLYELNLKLGHVHLRLSSTPSILLAAEDTHSGNPHREQEQAGVLRAMHSYLLQAYQGWLAHKKRPQGPQTKIHVLSQLLLPTPHKPAGAPKKEPGWDRCL